MNLMLTLALFGTLAWAVPIVQETERISKKDKELAEVMVDIVHKYGWVEPLVLQMLLNYTS